MGGGGGGGGGEGSTKLFLNVCCSKWIFDVCNDKMTFENWAIIFPSFSLIQSLHYVGCFFFKVGVVSAIHFSVGHHFPHDIISFRVGYKIKKKLYVIASVKFMCLQHSN